MDDSPFSSETGRVGGTTTVIRRRHSDGGVTRRQGGGSIQHMLEANGYREMRERIREGANWLERAIAQDAWAVPFTGIDRRDEQTEVLGNTLTYLRENLVNFDHDHSSPAIRGRIVAAARIGKTVLMMLLIAATGRRTTIVVPTAALVDQTVDELRTKLPSITVGAYYGDAKDVVDYGVTVATYQTLAAHARDEKLPRSIRGSALVFCDEGHETMTDFRQDALEAFEPQAVVIAFTATPDYDNHRALAVFYPRLIFELRMADAAQRKLLAPAVIGYRVIDVDASKVELRGEDYKPEDLRRVMRSPRVQALLFEECRNIRYHLTSQDVDGREIAHKDLGTIICCSSKEQARELHLFLAQNRPPETVCPVVVVDSTSGDRRREILRDFAAGRIDTIINIGVLMRGWNAPRCKLLIDLSPSISRVRAEQKFSRPLTKWGDRTGFIFVVYPHGLRPLPILPSDLLGLSLIGDDQKRFIAHIEPRKTREPKSEETGDAVKPKKKVKARELSVKDVALRRNILMRLKPPSFNPESYEEIRAVLFTCPHFTYAMREAKPPHRADFREMLFDHETFAGFGRMLLRHCRVAAGSVNFRRWLALYVPEFKLLEEEEPELVATPVNIGPIEIILSEDMDAFEHQEELSMEGRYDARRAYDRFILKRGADGILSERQRFALGRRLTGDSYGDIASDLGVSVERARTIAKDAIFRIIEEGLKRRIPWDWSSQLLND